MNNNIIDTFHINKSVVNKNDINNECEIDIKDIKLDEDIVLKKKKLIELTSNLTKIEYIEILNIIQEDKCPYSNNTNGVFINLTNIENKTIDKIFDFLEFTKHKKKELKEKENYLEKFKNKVLNNDEISKQNLISNNTNNSKLEEINNLDNLSEDSDIINYDDYLCFSSDDEDKK